MDQIGLWTVNDEGIVSQATPISAIRNTDEARISPGELARSPDIRADGFRVLYFEFRT